MISEAVRYLWSSYRHYTSKTDVIHKYIESEYVLEMFSNNRYKALALFEEYSNQPNAIKFAEVVDKEKKISKTIKGEAAAKQFIEEFVTKKGIKLEHVRLKSYEEIRNELLHELKVKSDLSIRQLAIILGINRGVIQRM